MQNGKLKIMVVCGCGMGTSMAGLVTIQKVMENLGVEADVEQCNPSLVGTNNEDIVATSSLIASTLDTPDNIKVIVLTNFINKDYVKEQFLPVLKDMEIIE